MSSSFMQVYVEHREVDHIFEVVLEQVLVLVGSAHMPSSSIELVDHRLRITGEDGFVRARYW